MFHLNEIMAGLSQIFGSKLEGTVLTLAYIALSVTVLLVIPFLGTTVK